MNSIQLDTIDNCAYQVACYNPEYTFVEKLQTISTKYRKYAEDNTLPVNFLRHYYDVYKLLETEQVMKFLGTDKYIAHKNLRFRSADEKNIKENNAFMIPNPKIRALFTQEFEKKSAMYFGDRPRFQDILKRIAKHSDSM